MRWALVDEHFFIFRSGPGGIDGVAVESAAELVVDGTIGDSIEGGADHFQAAACAEGGRVLLVDEVEVGAWSLMVEGNLGGGPKPPCCGSKLELSRS